MPYVLCTTWYPFGNQAQITKSPRAPTGGCAKPPYCVTAQRWSSDGVLTVQGQGPLITCCSNHLSYFSTTHVSVRACACVCVSCTRLESRGFHIG